MQEGITSVLTNYPGLTGREIAKRIGVNKKDVNRYLAETKHEDIFQQDTKYRWYLVKKTILKISFPENTWVTADIFEEEILQYDSPLESNYDAYYFCITTKCSLMVEAICRLLAFLNQLASQEKTVTIDFTSNDNAFGYFDRANFFEVLDERVKVESRSTPQNIGQKYLAENPNIIEFKRIFTGSLNEEIPTQLNLSLKSLMPQAYKATFTVIAELVGNVMDHVTCDCVNVAILQKYKWPKPHVQIVISDSGEGIFKTIRRVLPTKYPDIAEDYAEKTQESDALLLKYVFENGNVTSKEKDGGLGLVTTKDKARRLNATITIRQKSFVLKLTYKNNALKNYEIVENLHTLNGTHVCFDFLLD